MRGCRTASPALLALVARGGDATPEAPPTTPPPTTASTAAGPSRGDVEATLKDAPVYPPDAARLREAGLTARPGVSVDVLSPGRTYVCPKATGGNVTLYYSTATGKPSEKPCS